MFQEDLSVFLDGLFSSTAIINGVELNGIFNEEYAPAFEGETEGDRITFLVSTLEAQEINHGDSVAIGGLEENRFAGRSFRVKGKEKIGDGKLTELILKETGDNIIKR